MVINLRCFIFYRIDALRKFLRSLQVKNEPILWESRLGQVKFLQLAITQGLDGKLDYEIPPWLVLLREIDTRRIRLCKTCGKIFLAMRVDSMFCRPTLAGTPSPCRNLFNVNKFNSSVKRLEYELNRAHADEKGSKK